MHNPGRLFARKVFALGLPLVAAGLMVVAPAAAQFGLRTGALGGTTGSSAMSRPLGGFSPGYTGSRANRYYGSGATRRPQYGGYPYTYSVWVPDYFDYLNSQNQYAAPYGYGSQAGPTPSDAAPTGPQQPVIINQYFGAPAPPPVDAPVAKLPSSTNDSDVRAPGDPIANPQNYYLIAYKDHAVYTALAYWVEDKTLHYVTAQNTHNQASLDLIDLTLTKSLNQRNEVPFTIPGQ